VSRLTQVTLFVSGLAFVGCNGETVASQDGGADSGTVSPSGEGGTVPGEGGATPSDGGAGAAGDGGDDSDMPYPCSQVTFCTRQGPDYVCDCDGATAPACPASANEGQPCDYPPGMGCLGCSQGATFGCVCSDAGGASTLADASGSYWACVGGGQACQ
jgi:hypothetical protein